MSKERSRKKSKRGVTKTIVDEHGNVRVIKYKKKEGRIKNPLKNIQAFKPIRLPTTILGTVSLLFAAAAQSYSTGSVESYFGGLSPLITTIFDSMELFYRAIFTNIASVGLFGFLGYALITQGIFVKKYGIAFRQLMTIFIAYLIISSVLSPFLNYPGDIRQIPDDKFSNRDSSDLDVSALDSPFFNPQWDGDIPNLDQGLLNLTVADGGSLDTQENAYLIKWQTQEKWSTLENDFVQGDTATTQVLNSYSNNEFTPNINAGENTVRKFKASTLYYTVASSYSGNLLAPWNSEYGTVMDYSQLSFTDSNGNDLTRGTPTLYKNLNEDPLISGYITDSGSSGGIVYDAYFVAEHKSQITATPYKIADYTSILPSLKSSFSDRIPESLFDTITKDSETFTGIDQVWGRHSLPDYYFQPGGDADYFLAQYNQFKNSMGGDQAGIYAAVIAVTSFMQQKMIEALQNNPNMLDITNLNEDFAGSIDRGLYFYKAINTPGLEWGLKDFMPAYINMLRALGIPSRQVTGFAGGDIVGNTIQYSLQHALRWAEVLIPWNDGTNDKLSWGMFNPIPIPSLFANGILEFGKNTLGSSATISVNIDSGESFQGSPINLQNMGDNFNMSINVGFDQNPASGQPVQVMLLNQDELNTLQNSLDISSGVPGTTLGTFTTDDNGDIKLSGSVDYEGNMTLDQNPNFIYSINSVDVTAFINSDLNNLQSGANVYGIIALLGFSVGVNATAWLKNGTISVTSSLDEVSIPSVTGKGYITTPFQNFTFTATLRDNDGVNPIANESLNFYLLEQSAASGLDLANPDFAVLQNETMIKRVTGNSNINPQTTDVNGQTTVTMNFNDPYGLTPGTDDLYVLIVEWKGNLVYSLPVGLLVSIQASLTSKGTFASPYETVGTAQSSDPWFIDATLLSTTALLSGSTPGISGITMKILAVEFATYDGLTVNNYDDFESSVIPNANTYLLTPTVISGTFITDSNGKIAVNFTISGATMANGYYYLFLYSDDIRIFNQIDNGTANFIFAKVDVKSLNVENQSGGSQIIGVLDFRRRSEE